MGSRGNLRATDFFMREMASMGWETSVHELAAMDWSESGAALRCGSDTFQVRPSPYSRGCSLEAEMTEVSALSGLEAADISGRIVLLHGEIAREQIMPKNFIFYNPEDHRKIVSLLEAGGPLAIICATGRNSALAGGPYPFPMIEDGDFDIPSVYMTQEEGARLLLYAGEKVTLVSGAERIPSRAYNVTASKGVKAGERM